MINFADNELQWIELLHKLKKNKKYNDRELEIIFGSSKFKDHYITQPMFINILKYMKNISKIDDSEWKLVKENSITTLDISFHKDNDINVNTQFPLRITIKGKDNISQYCKTNDLASIINNKELVDIMFKEVSTIQPGDIDLEEKNEIFENGKNLTLQVDNYGIKFTLKDELILSHSNNFNTNVRELAIKSNAVYQQFKKLDFKNSYKTFRLKNRYSFISNSNVRLDLTVVQSSFGKTNDKNRFVSIPVKEFYNSKLLESEKKYEVELELFIDKEKIPEFPEAKKNIESKIELIQGLMYNYPFMISKNEENDILDIYKKLIQNNFNQIINTKKEILDDIRQINNISNDKPKKSQLDLKIKSINENSSLDSAQKDLEIEKITLEFNEINKKSDKAIDEIKQKPNNNNEYFHKISTKSINLSDEKNFLDKELLNINKFKKDSTFKIGPKPVTLDLIHIQNKYDGKDSIVNNSYTITDKADGLGVYLYIVGINHFKTGIENESSPFYVSQDIYDKYANNYVGKIYLIDTNLKIYSTNLKIKDKSLHDKYCNSLLNGELIDKDLNDKDVLKFVAYDIYFNSYRPNNNTTDTKKLPFMLQPSLNVNTRENLLEKIVENINTDFTDETSRENIFKISKKKFYLTNPDNKTDIFEYSKIVWDAFKNGHSEYKYDGLIYTPASYPVSYDNSNYNYDLYTGITWDLNLKWKPEYETTIDFLIKEEKDELANYNGHSINQSKTKTQFIHVGNDKQLVSYKTYNLYVGKNQINNIEHCRTQIDKDYDVNRTTKDFRYIPHKFFPTKPYNEQAHLCKLRIDSNKNVVLGNKWNHSIKFNDYTIENGDRIECFGNWVPTDDIITDDTIVEFSYQNYNKNDERYIDSEHFRWVPLRTRHDKTYSYKLGVSKQKELYNKLYNFTQRKFNINFTSSEKYLYNELKYIIDKVPNKIFNTKYTETRNFVENIDKILKYYPDYNYIPLDSRICNINYGNNFITADNNWKAIHNPITEIMITTGCQIPVELDSDDKYYRRDLSVSREKSITISMQEFHNKVVKNDILYKNVTNKLKIDGINSISLLDLATGKGGDIPKWINNNINEIVGIDIIKNNIDDEIDGACKRRNDIIQKYKNRNDVFPCTIDFLVGDVSKNIQRGYSFSLQDTISTKLYNQIWNTEFENREKKKFDIISMMFAIHYFFSDEITLDNLIDNIEENLNEGGYFIGTCFDGKEIFNYLSNIKLKEYREGLKDDNLIWRIKKLFNIDKLNNDNTSLGLKIEVFIQSINQEITEYIVNFDYLTEKLLKKGIRLLTENEKKDMNLPANLDKSITCEGTFNLIYDKISQDLLSSKDIPLKTKILYQNILKNMSEDEKIISSLNRFFIFKKETNVETQAKMLFIKADDNFSKGIREWRTKLSKFNIESNQKFIRDLINEYHDIDISEKVWVLLREMLLEAHSKNKFKITPKKLIKKKIISDDITTSAGTTSASTSSTSISSTTTKVTQSQSKITKKPLNLKKPIQDKEKMKPLLSKYMELAIKVLKNFENKYLILITDKYEKNFKLLDDYNDEIDISKAPYNIDISKYSGLQSKIKPIDLHRYFLANIKSE